MTIVLDPVAPGPVLDDGWTRRRLLRTVPAAGLLALGAACATGTSPAPRQVAADGFPARVDGAFGPTVVDAPPQRVVTLGYGPDSATVLALGVVPVGMLREQSLPGGIAPWSSALLAGRPTSTLSAQGGETPFEAIAALRPDLIVASTSYSLAKDHQTLAEIAPVLAYVTGPNTDRWQDTTLRAGQVLGRADAARALVDDTQARIAAARTAHPQLAGRTFTFGPVTPDGTVYTTRTPDDQSALFLAQLGMRLSPDAASLPESSTKGKAIVTPERYDLLDADLMILTYTGSAAEQRARLEADPLFQRIPAVRRGSYVALDVASAVAMAFPSVPALGYALDHVVDPLAAAVH